MGVPYQWRLPNKFFWKMRPLPASWRRFKRELENERVSVSWRKTRFFYFMWGTCLSAHRYSILKVEENCIRSLVGRKGREKAAHCPTNQNTRKQPWWSRPYSGSKRDNVSTMSLIYPSFFLSDLIVDGYNDNDNYESNNNVDKDNAKKDEIA